MDRETIPKAIGYFLVGVLLAVAIVMAYGLVGCSYFDADVPEHSSPSSTETQQLAVRADNVQAEIEAEADQATGWPSASDCDGTLWAGLACAAGVRNVNIDLAELSSGVIGRRPGPHGDCRSDEQIATRSGSSVSNDMFQGFSWCVWRTKRLDLAQRFATACESRRLLQGALPACVIGEPYPESLDRVVLRPNGLSIVGKILYALTDHSDDRDYRTIPSVYSASGADFERHLAALGIALNGELTQGELPLAAPELGVGVFTMFDVLRRLADADANDWTAQAVLGVYTGDYAPSLKLLLAEPMVCPTYARGTTDADTAIYCKVSWLFAARLVLAHHPQE